MMETMSSLALDANVPSDVRAQAIKAMESHLQAEREQQGSGINVILLVVLILSLGAQLAPRGLSWLLDAKG